VHVDDVAGALDAHGTPEHCTAIYHPPGDSAQGALSRKEPDHVV
jgi:hypothetical protein